MDEAKQITLEPCPFCGAPGQLEHFGGAGSPYRIVKCSKCRCDMHFWPTEQQAADKWNTRAYFDLRNVNQRLVKDVADRTAENEKLSLALADIQEIADRETANESALLTEIVECSMRALAKPGFVKAPPPKQWYLLESGSDGAQSVLVSWANLRTAIHDTVCCCSDPANCDNELLAEWSDSPEEERRAGARWDLEDGFIEVHKLTKAPTLLLAERR